MMLLMIVMMRAMGGVVLTEESVNDANCVYGEECIPSLKRDLDVFVPIAKCICQNFKKCICQNLKKCICQNFKKVFVKIEKMYLCFQRGVHHLIPTTPS